MLEFLCDEMDKMAEAIAIIQMLDDFVDLKFSTQMVSIMTTATVITDFVVALQLFPEYFAEYMCDQLQYSEIFLREIYPIMLHLEQCGFSLFIFSAGCPQRADITFRDEHGQMLWEDSFELIPSPRNDSWDVGEFDYSTFVTMDSQEFIYLIMDLRECDYVCVTLTSRQVKFSHQSIDEIVLTCKDGECVIGGVAPRDEISFLVCFQPEETFNVLAEKVARIWLFKTNNSSKGVMAAVLDLDSRFLAYFPRRANKMP